MSSALSAAPYPYRANSLNLFRLILAALVLFAHAFYLAGLGSGPELHGENLGGWAVAGFFVISGFLITRSRLRSKPGDYLLHRVARIFPAFLVCLVVIAFGFAPMALWIEQGSLEGFLTTGVTPFEYIWSNITLFINNYSVGATLQSVPYQGSWNGSLWTLFYEFVCYIMVWVLGGVAVFRKGPALALIVFGLSVVVWANSDLLARIGLGSSFTLLAKLAPFFFGGMVIYFIVERIGISWVLGVASGIIAAVLMVFIPHWGGQIAAPFLAYTLLWLSTLIPQPAFIAKNDVSYGFYIYAWPVQQMTALLGGTQWGFVAYLLITVVGTLILAWLSWVLVERPAMLMVRPVRHGEQLLPGDIERAPSV